MRLIAGDRGTALSYVHARWCRLRLSLWLFHGLHNNEAATDQGEHRKSPVRANPCALYRGLVVVIWQVQRAQPQPQGGNTNTLRNPWRMTSAVITVNVNACGIQRKIILFQSFWEPRWQIDVDSEYVSH